tara:strand:+ start:593 stop:1855 length:1263 start_codon:yes stop_codon:yes gene_type:complete
MKKSYNKKTFCVAPWIASHISTWDDITPCCLYKSNGKPIGKTRQGVPFFEHYNSKEAIKIRKDLWNGKEVSGCQECFFREKTGSSYRNSLNKVFADDIPELIQNTKKDFSLKKPKFKLFDLRFDNKCNLRCRMCSPMFSSSLYKEYKDLGFKLGHASSFDSPYHIAVNDKEYKFILSQLKNVKVLMFAGGEPLTQDKFYEILQYCIDKNLSKNISLWITSNCTKVKYKKYDLIKMLRQFKEVDLSGSIDAYGERANYMRYPSKWEDVETNILTFIHSLENLRFRACPTIQVQNIYHIFDLFKYLLINGICRSGDVRFNILTFPDHMDIKNLPYYHKKRILKKCDEMDEWFENEGSKYSKNKRDKEQIELLRSLLSKEADNKSFIEFFTKTDIVDKYRGNNFWSVFTEFEHLDKSNYKWLV